MDITADTVKNMSLDELEKLYRHTGDFAMIDDGSFRGMCLHRINNRVANRWYIIFIEKFGFEWLPFGLNFFNGYGDWYFFNPKISMGRFKQHKKASRWRDTQAIALDYKPSRVPPPFSYLLYDELKPLNDSLILGFGGMNFEKGSGDHFFFCLERVE